MAELLEENMGKAPLLVALFFFFLIWNQKHKQQGQKSVSGIIWN